jgi:3-deoxy-manno-octulosonate cytidylyltransferase (CMP-KDO synthetase)
MSYTVVIPARFGSSRLPGKPLADIAGKSMVQRVWERARAAGAARVLVATDDARILEHCATFGAEALLTDPDHPSGTDRLAEVARSLGLADDDIVVNVQGDEPLIPPAVIDQVAANLAAQPAASIATLCEAIAAPEAFADPNVVKVVFDRNGMALYFSRAPIPWLRDRHGDAAGGFLPGQCWRHLGIYAYRAAFLQRFVEFGPADIERTEALEQLRALHAGERIHVAPACEDVPGGVDTEHDLQRLREQLAAAGNAAAP